MPSPELLDEELVTSITTRLSQRAADRLRKFTGRAQRRPIITMLLWIACDAIEQHGREALLAIVDGRISLKMHPPRPGIQPVDVRDPALCTCGKVESAVLPFARCIWCRRRFCPRCLAISEQQCNDQHPLEVGDPDLDDLVEGA